MDPNIKELRAAVKAAKADVATAEAAYAATEAALTAAQTAQWGARQRRDVVLLTQKTAEDLLKAAPLLAEARALPAEVQAALLEFAGGQTRCHSALCPELVRWGSGRYFLTIKGRLCQLALRTWGEK